MWILTDVGTAVNLSNADFIRTDCKLYDLGMKDVVAYFNDKAVLIKECETEEKARLFIQRLYNDMLAGA